MVDSIQYLQVFYKCDIKENIKQYNVFVRGYFSFLIIHNIMYFLYLKFIRAGNLSTISSDSTEAFFSLLITSFAKLKINVTH